MKKIFIAAFIALTLSACNDDDRLANDDLRGDKIAGFASASQSASYFTDEGQIPMDVPVVLLGLGNGEAPSQPIELTYEIDASSTAVEGGEYSFGDTSRKVTIAAGSTFAKIPLLINTGDLNPTAATKLVLNLKSSVSGTVVLETSKQITVNFVGCISSITPGAYNAVVNEGSSGTVGFQFPETITVAGVNTFKTARTYPYYPGPNYNSSLPSYGFVFEDICGDITISSQPMFNYYGGNPVSGTGEVIDANSFKVSYEIGGSSVAFGNVTYTKI